MRGSSTDKGKKGKTVLFICVGNACRSIMAEALTRHYWGDRIKSLSAGVSPLGCVPPETRLALEEIGVSPQGLSSKGLDAVDLGQVDLVVNLSGYHMREQVALFKGKLINWYIRDPYGESLGSFSQTRDAIDWLVREKLPKWLEEP